MQGMYRDVEVVAHRGASAHSPEHTFAACDLALAMGAAALELDVRPARDGTLVVAHDPTLARTTGDPREIAEVVPDELAAPVRPHTLDEVLARYGTGTRWLVEIKEADGALTEAAVAAIERHRLLRHPTLQSFDPRRPAPRAAAPARAHGQLAAAALRAPAA